MTDKPLARCPKCHKKLRRLIGSGSGFIFKGSGFYATDYRKGAKGEKAVPKKEEPVVVPNHTEKIKVQVLAKIGKPPRLERVEVSRHYNGKYRVNIWQQPVPKKDFAVIFAPRIGLSYYLTVSDTGEILHSDPPMTKVSFDA
jgi:ssDNA-binding Zn-finger/Zn-ribbon topoisomerase 1